MLIVIIPPKFVLAWKLPRNSKKDQPSKKKKKKAAAVLINEKKKYKRKILWLAHIRILVSFIFVKRALAKREARCFSPRTKPPRIYPSVLGMASSLGKKKKGSSEHWYSCVKLFEKALINQSESCPGYFCLIHLPRNRPQPAIAHHLPPPPLPLNKQITPYCVG